MSKEAALEGLKAAHGEFVAALTAVPPEAMAFRKPDDDYSLGGLIAHNVGVLQHYRLVLGEMLECGFTEVRPQDPPGFWEAVGAESKEPVPAAQVPEALARLAWEHAAFVADLHHVTDEEWDRKGPVFYGTATDALPTGAEDILGWVRDHYREHVPHVQELAEAWQERQAAG